MKSTDEWLKQLFKTSTRNLAKSINTMKYHRKYVEEHSYEYSLEELDHKLYHFTYCIDKAEAEYNRRLKMNI